MWSSGMIGDADPLVPTPERTLERQLERSCRTKRNGGIGAHSCRRRPR